MSNKKASAFLTEAECKQIATCIEEAEKATSGEIRVLVVKASSLLPKLTQRDKEKAVIRRAKSEFVKLGMVKTRSSTGVLIMISLEERMVRVQPDKPIDDRLPQETWQPLVNTILEGIRSGKSGEGICNAIRLIGGELGKHFPIEPGDTNELPNEVIFKGRRGPEKRFLDNENKKADPL